MSPERSAGQPLLVVIDPVARSTDGESVRIARDVLRGGTAVKLVVPDTTAELDRVLAHRGRKRPVVVGDDRALQRVVQLLHRQRDLTAGPLGLVPVGRGDTVAVARALGIPLEPVAAARTVLGGGERSLDLLVDESGGVVLGGLRIPGRGGPRTATADGAPPHRPEDLPGGPGPGDGGPGSAREGAVGATGRSLSAKPDADPSAVPSGGRRAAGRPRGTWWQLLAPPVLTRTARTVARVWAEAVPALLPAALAVPSECGQRLRVEADGRLLVDVDRPVRLITVRNAPPAAPDRCPDGTHEAPPAPDDGLIEVLVCTPPPDDARLLVRARTVTVTGRDFSYVADSEVTGPVRSRTWTVLPGAWRLTVPT